VSRTRILIFGNSGSGKSTRARALAAAQALEHLDLDAIVWEPGQVAIPRPSEAIAASLTDFLAAHHSWVVEGCYGELVETAARHCTELIFLNPGVDACLANNRRRAWEPHKYASKEQQDSMLEVPQAWVAAYYTRDGSWSYQAHRRIFDGHRGTKTEVTAAE
jgi:adenylate kinase family enzyme